MMNALVSDILVVGGGCAGLLAAVNLKSKLPELRVKVLRHPLEHDFQPDGQASTVEFPNHIHQELGIPPLDFLRLARPIWRIGTRYQWGPREFFDHTCEYQVDTRYGMLSHETGFYIGNAANEFRAVGPASARMTDGKVFFREKNGSPQITPGRFGYHLEPTRLQKFLELAAQRLGISTRDGKAVQVIRGEMGIAGIRIEGGEMLTADLYVDATGSESLLLGQRLGVPYISFASSLPCDSAIVATWPRGTEPIRPHTEVQTMEAGWCWRTEHEQFVGCGCAFSSAHLRPDEVEGALRKLYPNAGATRLLKLRQGRHESAWADNVVAVGNAAALVEPLASAGLAVLAFQSQWLAQSLVDCDRTVRPTIMRQFNKRWRRLVEGEREFLGLFYKYNTRLDTPFWHEAQRSAHLGSLEEVVRCFKDVGPDAIHRSLLLAENDPIGFEGYFSVLIGQNVAHGGWTPPAAEMQSWKAIEESWQRRASAGFTVEEALRYFASSPAKSMTGASR
ncbi:MAG TPA: FAD-dependent oxidoreductase [Tepidisphaeraceae bacterium]|nr:FAD-dependent oxidoreductase [Tepidisphaeraceae bacterium]